MSANAPLPVWDITAESWRQVTGSASIWLRQALLPFLLLLALNRLDAQIGSQDVAGLPWRFVHVLLYALPMAWFLVPWYRTILPKSGGPAPAATYLRFVLRWLGLDVAFFVVVLPARLLLIRIAALDGEADPQMSGLFMLAALLVVPALYAYARCSLAIPAAAAGADSRYGQAWRRAEGNGWRIIGAALLASSPILVLLMLVPVAADPELPPTFARSVLLTATQIVLELVVATVLARIYLRLANGSGT